MKTVNGITVPEGADLSSASALRQFAEDVDALVQEGWDLHHAARHPECAIISMGSGLTISSGSWAETGTWDTSVRTTLRAPTGMSLGNGGFPSGIYLVGGTLHYLTAGNPTGISLKFRISDEVGVKYDVPVITNSTSTKDPNNARGEEFDHFMIPTQFHMRTSGQAQLLAYVHGGTSITCQTSRSRMWLWRVRGIDNA